MNAALRNLKLLDLGGQLCAVIIPLLCGGANSDTLLYSAFALGGWQVLSYLIHLGAGRRSWTDATRRWYGVSLLTLLCFGLLSLALPGLIILFLITLPLAGLALGILYFLVSPSEWSNTMDTEALSRHR